MASTLQQLEGVAMNAEERRAETWASKSIKINDKTRFFSNANEDGEATTHPTNVTLTNIWFLDM